MQWIPLSSRLRMLKRELALFKDNAEANDRLQKDADTVLAHPTPSPHCVLRFCGFFHSYVFVNHCHNPSPVTYMHTSPHLVCHLPCCVFGFFVLRLLQRAAALSELEAAKAKEKLLGRSRKKPSCAVCELPFALVNLPMTISYKAVLDLRRS